MVGLVSWHRRNLLFALAFFAAVFADAAERPSILQRAHAHNDYEHARPLLDALDEGFGSVEADIYLVDGELLVGHDRKNCRATRTLKSLYLEPLRQRIAQSGAVYPGVSRFTLWIDIKIDSAKVQRTSSTTEAESMATCAALAAVLLDYAPMLTSVSGTHVKTNAISIILTGAHPKELPDSPGATLFCYDSHAPIASAPDENKFTLAWCENWSHLFSWRGEGEMPPQEQRKLSELIKTAHRSGKRVRFWGTPDKPIVWEQLLKADVDWIGTDQLKQLGDFLKTAAKASASQ
jgi:hypothetical protein